MAYSYYSPPPIQPRRPSGWRFGLVALGLLSALVLLALLIMVLQQSRSRSVMTREKARHLVEAQHHCYGQIDRLARKRCQQELLKGDGAFAAPVSR